MKRRIFCATATLLAGIGIAGMHGTNQVGFRHRIRPWKLSLQEQRTVCEGCGCRHGGKLKITPHFGASLFKMPEIKRAVQPAQMGEFFLVSFQNESQIFGATDSRSW
jgi:hypothetical protein